MHPTLNNNLNNFSSSHLRLLNNSSFATAENSTSMPSTKPPKTKWYYYHQTQNPKYLNTTLFEKARNLNKQKSSTLYLTETKNTTIKNTTESTKMNFIDHKNKTLNNFAVNRKRRFSKGNLLPSIKKNKIVRDSSYTYIRKTNEIQKMRFALKLKKEAVKEYKENIQAQIINLQNTIYNVNSYKENLENNFMTKYNEQLRELSRQLQKEQFYLDNQEQQLISLKKEVIILNDQIIKKQRNLNDIEKWISLLIFIKENKEPTDIKIAIKKYKKNLIFENVDELDFYLKIRQNKNLRLLEIYSKCNTEKQHLIEKFNNVEIETENGDEQIENLLNEKKKVLKSLKQKNNKLSKKLNLIKPKIKKQKSLNYFKPITRGKLLDINEPNINKNYFGVLYKISTSNDVYSSINSIYITILLNNLKDLKLNKEIIEEINSVFPDTINNKIKIAMNQIKIIEETLDFINESIRNKTKNDIKFKNAKKEICAKIDNYNRKLKAEKSRKIQGNKIENLIKKIEEKNKRVNFLSSKKIDRINFRFNTKKGQKKGKEIGIKTKKESEDIWDYLDEDSDNEDCNEINNNAI